ncbi:pilus assembly protein, partial [Rhizobium leguminosarum]
PVDRRAAALGDIVHRQGNLQPGRIIGLQDEAGAGEKLGDVNWSAALNTSALNSGSASTIEVPSEIQDDGVRVVLTRV